MNNADQPAYPIIDPTSDINNVAAGLTKRELIAAMCLQGLVSNYKAGYLAAENGIDKSHEILVRASVMLADELLKQLTP